MYNILIYYILIYIYIHFRLYFFDMDDVSIWGGRVGVAVSVCRSRNLSTALRRLMKNSEKFACAMS